MKTINKRNSTMKTIDFDPETETLDFNVLPDKDIVVINF